MTIKTTLFAVLRRLAQAGVLALAMTLAAAPAAAQVSSDDATTSRALSIARDAAISPADKISKLRTLTEEHPRHAPALAALGEVLNATGAKPEALGAFERAVDADPTLYSAWQWVGTLSRELGQDLPRAVQAYRRALELGAPAGPTNNGLGMALAAQNKFEEALKAFDAALKADPDEGVYYNNAVRASMAINDRKRGRAYFVRSLDAAKFQENAVLMWGDFLIRKERPKEAVEDLRLAVAKFPDRPRIRYFLGIALADSGSRQRAAAIAELEQAQTLGKASGDMRTWRQSAFEIFRLRHPDDTEELQKAASFVFKPHEDEQSARKDAERAIKRIDPVIATHPAFPNARVVRGAAYRILGENAKARTDFEAVIAVDPGEPNALNHLAMIASDEGDAEAAARHALAAAENADRDPTILINAGIVLVEAGRCEDARRVLGMLDRVAAPQGFADPLRDAIKTRCGG